MQRAANHSAADASLSSAQTFPVARPRGGAVRKSFVGALALSFLLAAGSARAQTTTLIDTSLTVPVFGQTINFQVTSANGAQFIVGSGIFNPAVEGIGLLSGPSYFQVFALTNGTIDQDVFNTFTLTTKGAYSFTFFFANANGTSGDRLAFAATVTPLPPPNPCASVVCGPNGGTCDPASGACVCGGAETRCGDVCLDTSSDINNCGGCGVVCPGDPNGVATCASGACGLSCKPTYTLSGGSCVPPPPSLSLSAPASFQAGGAYQLVGTCANAADRVLFGWSSSLTTWQSDWVYAGEPFIDNPGLDTSNNEMSQQASCQSFAAGDIYLALPAGTEAVFLWESDYAASEISSHLVLPASPSPPAPVQAHPPQITAPTPQSTTVAAHGTVTLGVSAIDPNIPAAEINFSWSTTGLGSLGAQSNSANGSQITFTAPACLPASGITVTASAVDGYRLQSQTVFTITPAAGALCPSLTLQSPQPVVAGTSFNMQGTCVNPSDRVLWGWSSSLTQWNSNWVYAGEPFGGLDSSNNSFGQQASCASFAAGTINVALPAGVISFFLWESDDGASVISTDLIVPVSAPPVLDAQNLAVSNGGIYATAGQQPGEIFTVSQGGTLQGLEFSLASTGETVPANASIRLRVYDGDWLLLASASLSASALPRYSEPTLDPSTQGSGYFDLSSQSVTVSAGETLHAVLDASDGAEFSVSQSEATAGNLTVGDASDPTGDLNFKEIVLPQTQLAAPGAPVAHTGIGEVELSWTASPGASGYTVLRNGSPIASVSDAKFVDATATAGASYSYGIEAIQGSKTATSAVANVNVPSLVIDNENLDGSDGSYGCDSKQRVGETVVFATTGTLAGIEVGEWVSGNSTVHEGNAILNVYDAFGDVLATVTSPASSFDGGGSAPLSQARLGRAYYDLSAAGLAVTAGETLLFELSADTSITFGSHPGQGASGLSFDVSVSTAPASGFCPGGGQLEVNGNVDTSTCLTFKTVVSP